MSNIPLTKIEEDEEIMEKEKLVLKFDHYKIYADPRNYIVADSRTESRRNGVFRRGEALGFHRTLSDALEDIYEMGLKDKVTNSKTVENLAKAIESYHNDFLDKIKALKQLETVNLEGLREARQRA